jgi:hypothetical protein
VPPAVLFSVRIVAPAVGIDCEHCLLQYVNIEELKGLPHEMVWLLRTRMISSRPK